MIYCTLLGCSMFWRWRHGAWRRVQTVDGALRALPDRRARAAVLMIGRMTVVRYKVDKGIAWLAMNNPPLNALSHALRAGIVDGARSRAGGSQGARRRAHRQRARILERRRHQGIRRQRVLRRAVPARGGGYRRSGGQAGDRGDQRRLHGRRSRARAGLPLPRGAGRRQDRLSRRSSSASFPAPAARSVFRGSWVSKAAVNMIVSGATVPASTFKGTALFDVLASESLETRGARLRVEAHQGRQADPARARSALQTSAGGSLPAVREDRRRVGVARSRRAGARARGGRRRRRAEVRCGHRDRAERCSASSW